MSHKVIQLKNYPRHQEYKLRADILEAMAPGIIDIVTENDFTFYALKQIRPLSRSLANTEESIDKAIHKLRKHFGEHRSEGSNKEYFIKGLMKVGKMPGITYRKIENIVRADLVAINQLIKGYEANDYVQKLINDDEKPRNHEEKILHDFYKRCLAERDIILNYYLTGIKNRAMAQMEHMPGAPCANPLECHIESVLAKAITAADTLL